MPSEAPVATIQARGLARRFGSHTAVSGLDLDLHRGEVLGFLGPNGAGKTTTMQMLTGNLAPTGGSITGLHCTIFQSECTLRTPVACSGRRRSADSIALAVTQINGSGEVSRWRFAV